MFWETRANAPLEICFWKIVLVFFLGGIQNGIVFIVSKKIYIILKPHLWPAMAGHRVWANKPSFLGNYFHECHAMNISSVAALAIGNYALPTKKLAKHFRLSFTSCSLWCRIHVTYCVSLSASLNCLPLCLPLVIRVSPTSLSHLPGADIGKMCTVLHPL